MLALLLGTGMRVSECVGIDLNDIDLNETAVNIHRKMLGSTLYLVGKEVDTGEYVKNSNSCSMCKRMIINAGIDRVYIRDSKDAYRMIPVQQWIDDDESLLGTFGY